MGKLYGYRDIAEELQVTEGLLRAWLVRGKLPPPDYRLSRSPVWEEETIRPWIEEVRSETD